MLNTNALHDTMRELVEKLFIFLVYCLSTRVDTSLLKLVLKFF
jgi:hypothetical protein